MGFFFCFFPDQKKKRNGHFCVNSGLVKGEKIVG